MFYTQIAVYPVLGVLQLSATGTLKEPKEEEQVATSDFLIVQVSLCGAGLAERAESLMKGRIGMTPATAENAVSCLGLDEIAKSYTVVSSGAVVVAVPIGNRRRKRYRTAAHKWGRNAAGPAIEPFTAEYDLHGFLEFQRAVTRAYAKGEACGEAELIAVSRTRMDLDERPECRCAIADDAGAAHGILVRSQGGDLVVVGDETESADYALVGGVVAGMEEHVLVPDEVCRKVSFRERGPADRMDGETGEIEPVAGEPVGLVRRLPTVACDVDERLLFPEGTRGQ